MLVKLVVVGGDADPGEIHVRVPMIVGRGRQANLVVRHPLVSRRHCEVVADGGRLIVRDLGSLNGTFVNHERISETVLKSGDLLTVGSITFRTVFGAIENPRLAKAERTPWSPAAANGPAAPAPVVGPGTGEVHEEPLTTQLEDPELEDQGDEDPGPADARAPG